MQIGVLRAVGQLDPQSLLSVEALDREAAEQQIQLLFFDEIGLDKRTNQVNGFVRLNGTWSEIRVPIPSIVINEFPKSPKLRSPTERWLNGKTTFTKQVVSGKYKTALQVAEAPSLGKLVIPTALCSEVESVRGALQQHDQVVIKPDEGADGREIRIDVEDRHYVWQDGAKKRLLNDSGLERAVKRVLKQSSYVIQPYMACLTSEGVPYVCQVFLQRTGQGNWTVIQVYPKVGGLLQMTEIETFLKLQFPANHLFMVSHLKQVGLEIADHLNRYYAHTLDELVVDLVIDRQLAVWFAGADTVSEIALTEPASILHRIAYAKYLANRSDIMRNYAAHTGERTLIGMLIEGDPDPVFIVACASMAKLHEADYMYFRPEELFASEKRVAGHFFQRGQWVAQTSRYPDVLYDRLLKRGKAGYSRLYQELAAIPATHSLKSGSMNKSYVYNLLLKHPSLHAVVIPYIQLEEKTDALAFSDKYADIILKPCKGSYGKKIILISHRGSRYELFERQLYHRLDADTYGEFLQMLCGDRYLLQRYIDSSTKEGNACHLRLHLMKGAGGQWTIAYIIPIIALSPARRITNEEDTLRLCTKWNWFLHNEFGEKPGGEVDRRMRRIAIEMACYLEESIGSTFHEIALDLGIDRERGVWLFEANFNRIGSPFHLLEVARLAIPYAISLVRRPNEE